MNLQLQDAIDGIGRRYGLAELYVFGSRADEIAARIRGGSSSTPDGSASDVDVGVRPLLRVRLDLDVLLRLTDELERLLGVTRVDLVALPDADPFLALDAVRGELIYCADDHAQAEYELFVLGRAADLEPYRRARQELALFRYESE
jgi:uncharacterized protein